MSDNKKSPIPKSLEDSKKVLVLGGGFAGAYTLRKLTKIVSNKEKLEITIICNENFFLFAPMLPEVAMGTIGTQHITIPLRRANSKKQFRVVQADVQKVDLNHRQVTTTVGNFGYDYLVLSLGCVPVKPDFHISDNNQVKIFHLYTLHDSMLIRKQIINMFEQASLEPNLERRKQLLTFVVAGGGRVGVQLIAEMSNFMFRDLVKIYGKDVRDNIRLVLVEVESRILAQSPVNIGRYAAKHLKRDGIEIRLNSTVTNVWSKGVEINNSEKIATGTVIWVTGFTANPVIADIDAERDSMGRVLVNECLEVPGFPGVFALGDCAHFKEPKSGKPIPPRAHTTVRQAKIAARNILADVSNKKKKPYHYSNPFEIITLGPNRGLFRWNGLILNGFPGRFISMAGFSLLITGSPNRIRILMDRLLSLIFGRDTTHLRQIK